ncbi:hypothetical protein Celaphus_00014936, partial [Cervus elaphus hippelaphus]
MSTINLQQLHSVTELTELLRAKSSPRPDGVEDSTEFVNFFPDFIWTVQDFALELKLKGRPITEDQYLENSLKLIPGLRTLVVMYVDTINNGAVPHLEDAVTTLAQLENLAAMQKAADHYSEQMTKRLNLPTDTLQELLGVHAACEREAITVVMECSFQDKNQEFLEEACGHKLYRKALERLQQDYRQVPRKGVKVKNKGSIGSLQNRVQVDWARNEIIEKEQELPVQKLQEQRQHMVAKERSLQENIALLTEKLKRERENLRKEQNMMLEHKLKHIEFNNGTASLSYTWPMAQNVIKIWAKMAAQTGREGKGSEGIAVGAEVPPWFSCQGGGISGAS